MALCTFKRKMPGRYVLTIQITLDDNDIAQTRLETALQN